jgi:hypothetical protein
VARSGAPLEAGAGSAGPQAASTTASIPSDLTAPTAGASTATASQAAPQAGVPLAAYLSLAAGMALVGSYVGLSKLLVAAFPVFLLAWLRFGIAGVAMLHWLPRGAGDKPLSGRDRVWLFWQSFLGNFLFSICMLFGVAATSALAAGVAMAALPAAVALLSRLLLGERIRPRVWAAIACAALGIAVMAMARARLAQPPAQQAPWPTPYPPMRRLGGAMRCCSAPCFARPAMWSLARD